MWLWLLAVFLLIADWVCWYLFFRPEKLWLAILITVLIVLFMVGWIVWKRVRAVMKAKALEREILKQAEQQAMNARPDRRAEILELQQQVQRGLASLKQSKLGGGATGSALYSLPWYVIIGPPGAGKTTALKHSGLVFPFLDPRGGGGVRGIGGTRNCDWWFTNEAILLDTAGRYATEQDDHEEWLAFLGMLKKYRSRKPINGVLVAISVTDLLEATEEQIDTFAKKLRARVDEVMTRLQMVVPVYVVFTKCDLVAGFVEFWGDLRKSERAQIWGATFPLEGSDQRDPAKAFEAEFDLLVDTVHARAVRRIGTERQWENRQKIFQFPIEFQGLRQNLTEFVGALFQKNSFQETPIFRGVYFTSGTQEGRPMDRVIGGMLRAFNIAPQQQAAQPQGESKSYFVTDMFRRVVFPDQNVAGRTKGEIRRQLINRLIFAAVALFLAALLIIPGLYSYIRNQQLISEEQAIAAKANEVKWQDKGPVQQKAASLDALRLEVEKLRKYKADPFDRPWGLRWGMYQGNTLYDSLRSTYLANLQHGFADPTKRRLEDDLRTLPDSGNITPDQSHFYFIRLKTYLEMCDGYRDRLVQDRKDEDEFVKAGVQDEAGAPDFQTKRLTEAWGRALGTTDKNDLASLRPHVDTYLTLMTGDPPEVQSWNCDAKLIERTRTILKRVSLEERMYSEIVGEPNSKPELRITREMIFPYGSAPHEYIRSIKGIYVRGAFTKDGWLTVRQKLTREGINDQVFDSWVTGEAPEDQKKKLEAQIAALRTRYFREFTNEWVNFLKDLEVRKPTNNKETLDLLQVLSEKPYPYEKLIKTLADNTTLEEEPASSAEKAGMTLAERLKERARQNQTVKNIVGDAGVLDSKKPEERKRTDVEENFLPLTKFGVPPKVKEGDKPPPVPLTQYQEQIISSLVAILSDMRGSNRTGPQAAEVNKTYEEAYRSTIKLLNDTQSVFTRPLLAPFLLRPIELGYGGALNDLGQAAGGKWEAEVWKKWFATLQDKYPFTDSPKDASMADYTAFFKPKEGLLWKFYEENLKGALERQGLENTPDVKFLPSMRFGQSTAYEKDFLKCYDRGWEITMSTFPEGKPAETPVVEFELNLHSVSENVSEVTFEIDGEGKTYKNEPEQWLHAQWPAKEPKSKGARVRVRGYNGLDEEITRPGDFGFFRLLDAASRVEAGTEGGKRGAPPTIVVTWQLRSQPGQVKMDFKPMKSENVFAYHVGKRQRIFRDYKCPRIVVKR